MNILLLCLWGLIGVLNLASGEISKGSYGLIWFVLMTQLIARVLGV